VQSGATDATYLDVIFRRVRRSAPGEDGYNAFAYVYEGALEGIPTHAPVSPPKANVQ